MTAQMLVAELPIGYTGLNGSHNQSTVPITSLILANNVSYAEGSLTKEGGSAKYNSTAITGAPTVLGGFDWHPDSITQRVIVLTNAGNLLKDTGAGDFTVTLASGLTVQINGIDVQPIFVEGGKEAAANNRKLFIFTGINTPQVLAADGATTAAVTTPATDWSGTNQPSFGLAHKNRLWAGGNVNDPHRLYYTPTTDHEDFTAGSIAIYPGEGEKLVGGVSFKGFLVCFKYPKGIYIVDTTDPTIANWRVDKLNDSIGCAGLRAYSSVEDDILVMSPAGNIHAVSVITETSKGTTPISEEQDIDQWIRDNINLGAIFKATFEYYVAKKEVHIALPSLGSTVNNTRLVLDFNERSVIRFRTSSKDTCVSLWQRTDTDNIERLITGDDAGFVWLLDQETKSKDGAGYAGEFQTPFTDLSHLEPSLSTIQKNGKWLELVVEPSGNWDLNVTTYWDGVAHETVTFNMGAGGAALGSFVLDTDTLGGAYIVNAKRRIHGSGRRFSIKGSNSAAGQDFSIAKMYLHFTPGSTRLTV